MFTTCEAETCYFSAEISYSHFKSLTLEQISNEICINMQFELQLQLWLWTKMLIGLSLAKELLENYSSSLKHPLSKQKVFPELCCTDLSTNLCRSSCIHPPLNNPPSSHWMPNLFLETAFSLHNRCGMIEAALLFPPYKERCHDPFQSSQQSGCCTTSLLSLSHQACYHRYTLPVREAFSASPTETQHTWITSTETIPFRGSPGSLHVERLCLNPVTVCYLSGSGCGGESLMLSYCVLTYWMLVAVGSIFKTRPHSA